MEPIKVLFLVSFPSFYQNEAIFRGINKVNINNLFWESLLSTKFSLKIIENKEINNQDLEDLKFIIPKLEFSYRLLNAIKYKDIGVELMLTVFNIINEYFKISNKYYPGVKIKLYHYFKIDKSCNINENILYKFYEDNFSHIENSINENKLYIALGLGEEIFQIKIIQHILEKKGLGKTKIILEINELREFDNEILVKKHIKENLNNVHIKTFLKKQTLSCRIIFSQRYQGVSLFNSGCSWRKCSFCNIGKYEDKVLPKDLWSKNIKKVINFIKKEKFEYIKITDPSIEPEEIVYFSKMIIKEKLDLKIHLRTRFSKKYDSDALNIMSEAGVKFMGIGLESVSKRLNNLMRKYDEDFDAKDFEELIEATNNVGIRLHYYTIFGFPTEKKIESEMTKNFLLKNIKKFPFFTYTAGGLGLNKGTEMYNNPKKFNISIKDKNEEMETFIDFENHNVEFNENDLNNTVKDLAKNMFIKNIESNIDFYSFWHFIEHTNIFHIQKLKYDINPYFIFFDKNKDLKDFLNKNYKKNLFIHYKERKIKNWLTMMEFSFNIEIINFLKKYKNEKKLKENIQISFGKNIKQQSLKDILSLIENYFLIKE